MKKILMGLAAAGTAIAMVPLFAAFEAHVINVTARIENALQVSTELITFGTVFPQEELDQQFEVELSDSFMTERRVDDVQYFIRQKPKCGVTTDNGTVLVGPTATGHVIPTLDNPQTPEDESKGGTAYTIDCGPDPRQLDSTGQPQPPGSTWGVLPSLCPYLSKHPIPDTPIDPPNDGSLNAFHQPFSIVNGQVVWTDVAGYLAKSAPDILDIWNIDLKVPCFGGYCAQDWADYVHHWCGSDVNPDDYVQPIGNEHKVFGCDLWVEVSDVSEYEGPNGTDG